ncbi:hypothetical protein M0802_009823 [Mischocyttarus mexicanus]|nr:hypothetical protein M0802_009823 [Mischocyttarus mexicanus]
MLLGRTSQPDKAIFGLPNDIADCTALCNNESELEAGEEEWKRGIEVGTGVYGFVVRRDDAGASDSGVIGIWAKDGPLHSTQLHTKWARLFFHDKRMGVHNNEIEGDSRKTPWGNMFAPQNDLRRLSYRYNPTTSVSIHRTVTITQQQLSIINKDFQVSSPSRQKDDVQSTEERLIECVLFSFYGYYKSSLVTEGRRFLSCYVTMNHDFPFLVAVGVRNEFILDPGVLQRTRVKVPRKLATLGEITFGIKRLLNNSEKSSASDIRIS